MTAVVLAAAHGLADPGDALDNAYKAAFVCTRIVQPGDAPFSGANNYDWLLNHDVPGILANEFELGPEGCNLLNAVNKALAANETVNNFDFLPYEVNQPVTADRCDSPNDATHPVGRPQHSLRLERPRQ
jgi:hypothetical protein